MILSILNEKDGTLIKRTVDDQCRWVDAVDVFFQMLQGAGYCFSAETEELAIAAEAYNDNSRAAKEPCI